MSFFEKNLASLKKHHPSLVEMLRADLEQFTQSPQGSSLESFQWIQQGTNSANLVYKRLSPSVEGLLHPLDPVQEADQIILASESSTRGVVFCLGMGLGYVPIRFLEEYRENSSGFFLIESNPQFFLRSLCLHDFTPYFENENISWFIGKDFPQLQNVVKSFFYRFNVLGAHLKFIHTPSCLAIEESFYKKAAEIILSSQEIVLTAVGTSVEDSFSGFENTVKNFPKAIVQNGVRPMFGQFKGGTCISLAAGPSLNQHWDLLKTIQGKFPIIACDTLVKPLLDHGIVADFVTAIEKSTIVTDFFHGFSIPPETYLVAPTLIYRESFDAFEGRKLMYAPAAPYIHFLNLAFLGHLSAGGSAGNLNLALANAMGFSNIILVGHDLAYGFDSHETHVRGTIDPSREVSRSLSQLSEEANGGKVRSQDGLEEVWTRYEWNAFRYHIENLITKNRDKQWINTSHKGACIEGTITSHLVDAIRELNWQGPSFEERMNAAYAPIKPNEIKERILLAKKGVEGARLALHGWLKKATSICQKIESFSAAGKGENANLLFNEITEIKINALKNDRLFYQAAMSVLHPVHVELERSLGDLIPQLPSSSAAQAEYIVRHQDYFQSWLQWIPKVCERLDDMDFSMDPSC